MAKGTIYKRGNRYWYGIYIKGIGKRQFALCVPGQTRATTSKGIAEIIAKKIRLNLGQYRPAGKDISALLDDYETVAGLDMGRESLRRTVAQIRIFFDKMQISSPRQITRAAIKRYLAIRKELDGAAAKTLCNYKTAISSFCTFLVDADILAENPARGLRIRLAGPPPPVMVPDESVNKLIHRAGESGPRWLLAGVLIAARCGLRVSELAHMKWDWVNFADRCIIVGGQTPGITKSRRTRTVPAPDDVLAALNGLGPGSGYIFPARTRFPWLEHFRPLTDDLEGFCAREGSRVGRRWHALRGYAAMSAARRGATIIELMYQFGWTSFAMAQRYIDIAQAGRRA